MGCIITPVAWLFGQTVQVSIDPTYTYQTIEAFSASDCWAGNYVGESWNENKKEQIAKYLFSQNIQSNGTPEGIGLSMWRVNLGAGTAEQGEDSDIGDFSRRAECFLDENGQYDWTKQAGQQYFIEKAKEYGCNNFVAFCNSPLTIYTRNGKGYAIGDGNSNLKSDKYSDFAEYLGTVLEHFEKKGTPFSYISPVNEPQYDWKGPDPGQEGTPFQNSEIKKLAVELDKSINNRNLSAKMLLTEAASWEYLYSDKGRASNQIYSLFDKRSADYIGDLTSLANVVAGHSYWTHWDNETLKNTRYAVKVEARKYGLGVFQTEWSMLSGASASAGFVNDMDSASYMDIALFMAKIIHSDLSFAEVSSWSYWTAMAAEQWNHKDRFLLLALKPGGDFYNPINISGEVYPQPTLWALGNYSLFIRPGYKRIKLDGASDLNGVMGTAYLAPDSSRIVAVFVNMTYGSQNIQTSFANTTQNVLTNKRYLTSVSYNLKKYGSASSETYTPERVLSMPARSVMTVVYDLDNSGSGIGETAAQPQMDVYPNPVEKSGQITISLPVTGQSNVTDVSLLSLNGKVVYKEKKGTTDGITNISLPQNISPGSYVIRVGNDKNIYREKIIVY